MFGPAVPAIKRVITPLTVSTIGINTLGLFGPPGCGKNTIARFLAASHHCAARSPTRTSACGECSTCIARFTNTHPPVLPYPWPYPEYIEIDSLKYDVDRVRDVIEKIEDNATFRSRLNILVFDEFHHFQTPQQGRFLKLFEDGIKNTLFIVSSSKPADVLEPIIQRCSPRLNLSRPDRDSLFHYLEHLAEKVDLKYEAGTLEFIADSLVRDEFQNEVYTVSFRSAASVFSTIVGPLEDGTILTKEVAVSAFDVYFE
jgi:DNA polymerase III gamma/tau subunit